MFVSPASYVILQLSNSPLFSQLNKGVIASLSSSSMLTTSTRAMVSSPLSTIQVDSFAQIENKRLRFHQMNQPKLRAELYSGLHDAILGGADLADIGQRTILPSTFIGSPRHMIQQYQDAMAIVRDTSNPDLFITFTANPQWPEITENILPGQTAQDRPDIVS